jgi:regulator of replication initiation timing
MDYKRKSIYVNQQQSSSYNKDFAPKKVKFNLEPKYEEQSLQEELKDIKNKLEELKKYINQPMVPLEEYLKLEKENQELKQKLEQIMLEKSICVPEPSSNYNYLRTTFSNVGLYWS